MVRTTERGLALLLAATVNCNVAGPAPAVADALTQDSDWEISQLQPAPVPRFTLAVPPEDGMFRTVSLRLKVQDAPDCVRLKLCPAIVSVVMRGELPGFGATDRTTVPLPVPLAPLDMVTHEGGEETVHAQPKFVCTVTVWFPPEEPMEADRGVML